MAIAKFNLEKLLILQIHNRYKDATIENLRERVEYIDKRVAKLRNVNETLTKIFNSFMEVDDPVPDIQIRTTINLKESTCDLCEFTETVKGETLDEDLINKFEVEIDLLNDMRKTLVAEIRLRELVEAGKTIGEAAEDVAFHNAL